MKTTERSFAQLLQKTWKQLAAIAAITLALGVAIYFYQQRTPPVRSQALEARLELAAGEVKLEVNAKSSQAYSGIALLKGSNLSTGSGARALARLSDGSALFLREKTEITLQDNFVVLQVGEIWVDAPPTERRSMVYHIGQASVSADDAGLSIKKDQDDLSVYVARGLATLNTAKGRVEVQAGEQAVVTSGAAPKVSAMAFWLDWTGGMGDHRAISSSAGEGSGRIYGVDLRAAAGSPPRSLEVSRQAVQAVIRDGLAETEVDQTFFNPGQNPVEGWYWFSIPAGASVTSFELETNGVLIPGELIERKEAAKQYGVATQRGHDPALLEWIDSKTYRARIYPVNAGATRRVVLRYIQLLPTTDGKMSYLYPLQSDTPLRIGEFSLSVDLGQAGTEMQLTTLAEARIEQGGRRVTMRRSGYTPRADFLLEATLAKSPPPFRLARFSAHSDTADYIMARYAPQIDWTNSSTGPANIVLVVDTSAAGDENGQQLKAVTAEAILHALSAEDRFSLLSLDVRPTVLHPKESLAPATEEEIQTALEKLADHSAGGATDMAALFDVALSRLHGTEQPAVIYIGDGLATSGELSGQQLAERLRRALATSRARFFTVAVGADADRDTMQELARVGGGRAFRVDSAEETTERALRLLATIKTPTITDFDIDLGAGLDEVFHSVTGKVSRGDEVVVLARTHHDIPKTVTVKGRLFGKDFDQQHRVHFDRSILGAFVPRLWAIEKKRRILGRTSDPELERGRIVKLGLDYGLMTPFTSFLALDSEQAYHNQGIPRRHSRLRGVRLSGLSTAKEQEVLTAIYGLAQEFTGLGCMSQEATSAPSQEPMAMVEVEKGATGSPHRNSIQSAPPPAPKASVKRRPRRIETKGSIVADKSAGSSAKEGSGRRGTKDADQAAFGEISTVEPPQICSDASKRPLAQRILLWKKRFRTAHSPQELLARYHMARAACEIPDWGSEAIFLRMLARHIHSEVAARTVLTALSGQPEIQRYVAGLVLRIAVEPQVAAAVRQVLFGQQGQQIGWQQVDLELAGISGVDEQIEVLRRAIAQSPEDPRGTVRLVRLLAKANRLEEALLHSRKLHDHGLMTPLIARQLGAVLASNGLGEEAIRTYSEIVEFDPQSLPSRRLLGDVYLSHGWYQDAYRQYRTLTEMEESDPLNWLRLAAAAAGAGRVDEALRIERRVAQAEGKPGPADPRRWARLSSAARLANMLAHPPKSAPDGKQLKVSLMRKLKQLQLFRGPSTLVVLTWEDLDVNLALTSERSGQVMALGENTDAAEVGLAAALMPSAELTQTALVARLRSLPRQLPMKLKRHDITWDGRTFEVKVSQQQLNSGEKRVEL